jgi:hypothetical protein
VIIDRDQAQRSSLRACLALVSAIGPIHERATVDDAITLIQSGAVDLVVARYEASTTPALIERIKQFERSGAPLPGEESGARRPEVPLLACVSWRGSCDPRWPHPNTLRVARQLAALLDAVRATHGATPDLAQDPRPYARICSPII